VVVADDAEVGALVVGVVGLPEGESLEDVDGVVVGPEVCTTGEGWCPRAGVIGLGETTR
jgi:hypothetical protein